MEKDNPLLHLKLSISFCVDEFRCSSSGHLADNTFRQVQSTKAILSNSHFKCVCTLKFALIQACEILMVSPVLALL